MLSPSSSRTYVRLSFLVLVAVLAPLLTARYKLEETPYNRPYGAPVNLGHQANQVAFSRAATKPAEAASAGQVDAATDGTEDGVDDDWWDEDDDWDIWGMTATKSGWDPLEADSTPFTELQVKTCVLSPGLYDMCSPTSSAKEDATKGKWERIDRDVSRKAGIKYLYIYARRLLPGSNADVITDLRLLDHRPTASELSNDGLWVEVSTSLRDSVWPRMTPLFLHYKLTPQADVLAARKMDATNGSAGTLEPITELDVLYGGSEVQPLPGFVKVEQMVSGGEDDAERVGSGYGKGKRVGTSLAYRKEQTKLPPTPVLRFSNAGNFTILQVADLHFSVGPGECRDMDERREAECRAAGADVYSLRWLETALDEVKPDLVVLSGDQLNGQKTSWDARSVILKWAPLLWQRNIPWTVIYGNHDHEDTDLTQEQQMSLTQRLPLFLGEAGPSGVTGTGNYVRSIRAPAAAQDDTALFNLYFLDSHAYAKKLTPWGIAGYDYLKADQINWFRGRSAQMKPFLRPYTPPRKLSSSAAGGANRKPAAAARPNRLPAQEDDARSAFARTKGRRAVRGVEERQDTSGGFGTEVEPDDGSHVVQNPEDVAEFEEDDDDELAVASATGTADAPKGTTNALLEAEEALLEDEGFFEPTELPQGPTALNPMQAKPNAMTFFHIPLRTSYESPIDISPSGKRLRVGERLEGSGASKTDSGFFEQAILAQGELPVSHGAGDVPVDAFWDGEAASPTAGRPEVKVLAHGHCHLTSDCRRIHGVWVCFGGGATYSGYGSAKFARRMRVYHLSDFGERIETYQLTDDNERVNAAMLYGDGSLEEQ
ncbi:Phosphatase dcr2 [Rhodotorula kratochvilovae]